MQKKKGSRWAFLKLHANKSSMNITMKTFTASISFRFFCVWLRLRAEDLTTVFLYKIEVETLSQFEATLSGKRNLIQLIQQFRIFYSFS